MPNCNRCGESIQFEKTNQTWPDSGKPKYNIYDSGTKTYHKCGSSDGAINREIENKPAVKEGQKQFTTKDEKIEEMALAKVEALNGIAAGLHHIAEAIDRQSEAFIHRNETDKVEFKNAATGDTIATDPEEEQIAMEEEVVVE